MTKAIEDAANALAIRTALGVPTNAELAAVSGVAEAAYVKPADGIPHNDLHNGIRDQLDLADTALQPGALPVGTTVAAAQISDAGAAGRTLLQKATLPEIQSLVSAEFNSVDVIIYGATPAGICAAIAVQRAGRRALLISDSERVGGMLGWGITAQDIVPQASPAVIPGLSRKILTAIGARMGRRTAVWSKWYQMQATCYPHAGISVLEEALAECGATVVKNAELLSAIKSGTVIQRVNLTASGVPLALSAPQFIDASYCGDLARLAGCSGKIGRESTTEYGEAHAGITAATNISGIAIDPYITPGNAGSGLIYGIDSAPLGTVGGADTRVMSFNLRLFVTNNPANRIPFPAPNMSVYAASKYEALGRLMAASPVSYTGLGSIVQLYQNQVDGTYFDLNSSAGISTNYPLNSELVEYVTATKARRTEIAENVKQWTLGLLYWIRYSGDTRIPAAVVTDIANYGLVSTQLKAYGGLSPELYVREGRRIVGDYVFKQGDFVLTNGFEAEAIGFAYYELDSHIVRYLNVGGVAKVEGPFLVQMQEGAAPQIGSPIPLKILFPKASEVTNLLCPGCPSVTRVAWSCTRLEANLMNFGEAAGIAATQAITDGVAVQSVNPARVREAMDPQNVTDGLVMTWDGGGGYQDGTVTQTPAASWGGTTSRFGYIGTSSGTDSNAAKGKKLRFAPNITEAGGFEVLIKYPCASINRASNVPVMVSHVGGTAVHVINQLSPINGLGGDWESLGVYTFRRGSPSQDYVEIDTTGTNSFVVISAIKFRRIS